MDNEGSQTADARHVTAEEEIRVIAGLASAPWQHLHGQVERKVMGNMTRVGGGD
jgi:hypothetical protein